MPHQTAFARAIRQLGHQDLVELFGRRANRTTIANWIAGKHPAPQWAIDRINQEWLRLEASMRDALAGLKPGPGKKAGTLNIKRFNQSRQRDVLQ